MWPRFKITVIIYLILYISIVESATTYKICPIRYTFDESFVIHMQKKSLIELSHDDIFNSLSNNKLKNIYPNLAIRFERAHIFFPKTHLNETDIWFPEKCQLTTNYNIPYCTNYASYNNDNIYLDDIKKYKKKFSDIYQYDCLNLIFSAKKPFVYEDNELLCNKKTINVILDVSNEKSIDYLDNITTIITRKLDIKEFMPIKENYDVIRYINDYLSLPTIGCTENNFDCSILCDNISFNNQPCKLGQCTDIEKKCKIKNCDKIIHKSVKPKNEGKPTSEENNYKTKYLYIIILACSLVLFITIIGIGIISLIFFQKKQERRVPRVKSIKRRRHGSPGITKINLLKINTVNRDIQKMGVTMYDFKPSDNEEVVCKKGDIVRILEEEIKVGWYIIKTKTGYIGCIPEEFINIIYISNAELKKLGYDGVEDLVNEFDSDNCDYTCSLDDRHSMGRSIFEKIPESKRCSTIHHTNKDGQYRISRISITNNRQLSFIQSSGEIGDYLPKSHDSEYSEGSEQSNDIVNKISSILSMRNSTAIKALSTKRASYVKSAILDRLNIEPRNSDSGKTLFLIESASEFDDDL